MDEICVDCLKETCPIPLIETRKALNKANKGDIVEVTGTHQASKKEIPMAVEALGSEILSISEKDGIWTIKIIK
jgi:TusA-related sulfurtransferase